MYKIALLAVVTMFISLAVKNGKTEYAIIISIAGCLLIFTFSLDKLQDIIGLLKKLSGHLSINNDYISLLLKITGITYISELASDICRDAGYTVLSTQIELAAKLCIMAVSIPVLNAIINTIDSLII